MNSVWDEIRVNPISRCLTKLHTHELVSTSHSITLYIWETVSQQINVLIQHEIAFNTKSSVHDHEDDLA